MKPEEATSPSSAESQTPAETATDNPPAEKDETKDNAAESASDGSGGEGQGASSAKKKGQRFKKGSFPPTMTLEEASTIITSFYENTGGEASVDALSSLTNNTSASSVFQRKLATLRNYGVIQEETQEQNRIVSLTELGLRIAAPHDPAQKVEAQREAFLKIEVFKNAYERYKGRILPQDEFLINAFTSSVPRELAGEWVEKFKSSAETAGLIEKRNGKLQVRESVLVPSPEKDKGKMPADTKDEAIDQGEHVQQRREPPPPPEDVTRTPIPLGPGRLAYIELPKGWESKDLKKLLRLLTLALGEDSEEAERILSSL
jgi:hypothetical protein